MMRPETFRLAERAWALRRSGVRQCDVARMIQRSETRTHQIVTQFVATITRWRRRQSEEWFSARGLRLFPLRADDWRGPRLERHASGWLWSWQMPDKSKKYTSGGPYRWPIGPERRWPPLPQ